MVMIYPTWIWSFSGSIRIHFRFPASTRFPDSTEADAKTYQVVKTQQVPLVSCQDSPVLLLLLLLLLLLFLFDRIPKISSIRTLYSVLYCYRDSRRIIFLVRKGLSRSPWIAASPDVVWWDMLVPWSTIFEQATWAVEKDLLWLFSLYFKHYILASIVA